MREVGILDVSSLRKRNLAGTQDDSGAEYWLGDCYY
jgi:hypothetical protein